MAKTHTALVHQDLDYLAIEAQIAQQDLAQGRIAPTDLERRFRVFSAEVERLARSGCAIWAWCPASRTPTTRP